MPPELGLPGAEPAWPLRAGDVAIRPVVDADADAFVAGVAASRALHAPWVTPPATVEAFLAARRSRGDAFLGLAVVRGIGADAGLAGIVNLSQIWYGNFCSAYLGYYAFAPHAGAGAMTLGLGLAVHHAFTRAGLHRLEANIQPGNTRSIALVQRLGFVREGFSPAYLRIDGAWRDHERWAIRSELWTAPAWPGAPTVG